MRVHVVYVFIAVLQECRTIEQRASRVVDVDWCDIYYYFILLLLFYLILIISGQVVDGVATPLVGVGIDHSILPFWLIRRFGRRNSWHLIGIFYFVLLVFIIFRFTNGHHFISGDFQ